MFAQRKLFTGIGWACTILVAFALTSSAMMKLLQVEAAVKGMVEQFGYSKDLVFIIGIVELSCLVMFLFPRTEVLGAILLTGYLGGAVATHVRVSDPFYGGIIVGVLVWLGLFFREPRLRALLPFRLPARPATGSDSV